MEESTARVKAINSSRGDTHRESYYSDVSDDDTILDLLDDFSKVDDTGNHFDVDDFLSTVDENNNIEDKCDDDSINSEMVDIQDDSINSEMVDIQDDSIRLEMVDNQSESDDIIIISDVEENTENRIEHFIGLTSNEFCFEVEIKSPDSYQHQVETSQPYFITPTIPHDSVTQCVPGKSCHALLFMSGGFYPECPFVKQTDGPSDDLHIFTSADNTKLIGNCTTDVTFTPPPGSTGKYRFCFNIFLPNIPGETRCFYVIYMEYTPVPIRNEHFPLGCTDYEDINFSCRNWNNSIGICRTTYDPVHTIARHRCPRFCSLCHGSIGVPQSQLLPTIASGTCGNILGNDCLTINITNICRNTFGQKYCAKHCNQCTESVGLLPDLGSLFGRK
ncbi:Hypothetical predicted protein [Mytilus galloprovincialis]|uniref:ShKT domain-containing protein n=1 Tax=Mytilus galloprovincialis TaxID=29158 RepID=A0A8B6H9S8_MYTGA|nr:Hypothetical predicted protein [Mytilus galloprovincialis]